MGRNNNDVVALCADLTGSLKMNTFADENPERFFQVGIDEDKNVYFQNKKDTKRWVIYSGVIESTKINPEWNNWLRFTSSSVPTFDQKYKWQKEHTPNQTGTKKAYNPSKSKNVISKKYTTWKK